MRNLLCLLVLLSAPAAAFTLPQHWVNGRPGEVPLQVHQAAEGTWILRQSKTTHFEAPFLYLLAGSERALLLDTGAQPENGPALPLRATVDRLLRDWPAARAGTPFPLVVAHSHGHGDHHGGDAQFADRPNTTIVAIEPAAVAEFFRLREWPQGESALELGQRSLEVIPLPGHEPAHIAIYDAQTRSLFTGDSVYPGLITIRDLPGFRDSLARLLAFSASHRVDRLLGAHIEMSRTPGQLYPIGSLLQPAEHELALTRAQLTALHERLISAGDFRHDEVLTEFVLTQVLPAPTEPASTHGMLLIGSEQLWLSHLPMFHSPHDYQAIARIDLPAAALTAYRLDKATHPEAIYTLAPRTNWRLTEGLGPGKRFDAALYRGHFERGGEVLLPEITVTTTELVHLRRFDSLDTESAGRWIEFGAGTEHFLAHRIDAAPDFDQIVQLQDRAPPTPVLRTAGSTPLGIGTAPGGLLVTRVIYTEFGDLAR